METTNFRASFRRFVAEKSLENGVRPSAIILEISRRCKLPAAVVSNWRYSDRGRKEYKDLFVRNTPEFSLYQNQ